MHVSIASNATCSARLQLSHSHVSQPSKSTPRPRRGAHVVRHDELAHSARSAHLTPGVAHVAHVGLAGSPDPRSRGSRGSPGSGGISVVSSVNRCSFFRTAFSCIYEHFHAFNKISLHSMLLHS